MAGTPVIRAWRAARIALFLCHGLSARTSVAVLGTLISLVLIGVLGPVFTNWAHLTGNTSEETGLIHDLYPNIEIRGLCWPASSSVPWACWTT